MESELLSLCFTAVPLLFGIVLLLLQRKKRKE